MRSPKNKSPHTGHFVFSNLLDNSHLPGQKNERRHEQLQVTVNMKLKGSKPSHFTDRQANSGAMSKHTIKRRGVYGEGNASPSERNSPLYSKNFNPSGLGG